MNQRAKFLAAATTRRPPLALVALLAIAGFLVVTTGFAASVADQKEAPRKSALINQILLERQNVDDLDQAVALLKEQVAAEQAQAGSLSSAQDEQNRRREELAMLAGTAAVEGEAVEVRVSDAPPSGEQSALTFGTDRVQDGDLQLLVNALFAAGAEAVAINDNRISVVTPIRAAGATIVVNYRPVSSPYRIVAVGADKKQFESSDVAMRFGQWEKKYGLGYSVDTTKKATIPAYSGRVGIDVAHPR
jgi:uncharacterized protein YlxW (UPF0749 family)